jgi:iron(III) transport system substrate-binding protein
MVIAYNKKLVAEADKPATWSGLLDARWKGKIIMANPMRSDTAYVQLTILLHLFGKEDGKGWEVVRGIVKNGVVVDSSNLVIQGVNSGEYALGLTDEFNAWKYIKTGGPVGAIYPTEGTSVMINCAALVKGSQHPRSARRFLDWLHGRGGQDLTAMLGARPIGVEFTPPGLPAMDTIKLIHIDRVWATAQRRAILDRFQGVLTE